MRFIVDAQLSPRLVDWLRRKGHDAHHVGDVLGLSASDHAIALDAADGVLISKNSDFLGLLDTLAQPPQFLWLRIGNASNDVLLARLEASWGRIEGELEKGAPIVEV